MALVGAESWELYGIADITDYFLTNGGTPGITTDIIAGAGRCGQPAYLNTTIGSGAYQGVALATPYQAYVGYANYALNYNGLARFTVSTTSGAGDHLALAIPVDGSVQVWLGGPQVLGGSVIASLPPGTVTLNHYHHYGFEFLVDLTSGYVKFWLDGALRISLSGIRTVTPIYPLFEPTILPVTRLLWSPLGYLSDVYWGDASGPAPQNAFLGDLRVQGQLVLTDAASGGGGTYKTWTPSTGTDHGALVDENPPDDGATYVEATTVGLKETFKFPPVTLGFGTVYGVMLMPNIVKTASTLRQIGVLVRSGGSDALASSYVVPQGTYLYASQMYNVNPVSGLPWTAATVDAMEGGVEVTL